MDLYSFINNERAGRPLLHGNGFIQLDLLGERRMHFWSRDLPRQTISTPIHNHIFDMRSKVIKGHVIHVEHRVEVVKEHGHYEAHVAVPVGENRNTKLVSIGQQVDITDSVRTIVAAGGEYIFDAFKFHESEDGEPAISIISKEGVYPGVPTVLVPKGSEPDNEFRRDAYPEQQLWDWLYEIVDAKDSVLRFP